MLYLLMMVAGGLAFILVAWIAELASGGRDRDVALSVDERVASERVEDLLEAFAEDRLPRLGRRDILKRVNWLWKSVRTIALRSGRWTAAPWLALYAFLCLAVSVKTLIFPNSHDLRLLMGGRDFISFLVMVKKRPGRPAPEVEEGGRLQSRNAFKQDW